MATEAEENLRKEYWDLVRAVKIDDAASGPSPETLVLMVARIGQLQKILFTRDEGSNEIRRQIY
jgi:hypothetical protein